jgi:hypothetical protein
VLIAALAEQRSRGVGDELARLLLLAFTQSSGGHKGIVAI